MDRLQKKCVIASTGAHLLLFAILLVGPGFLARKDKPDDLELLDFTPIVTTDLRASGGGDPRGATALPAPTPTPPKPEPKPAPEPVKPPERIKTPEPEAIKEPIAKEVRDPESFDDASKKPKRNLPNISTVPEIRRRDRTPKPNPEAEEAAAAERAAVDRRRRAAAAVAAADSRLQGNLSGSTSIVLKGPGGGGLPYANFLQAVKTRYAEAWVVPDGISDDDATTTASVTIARDGTVISARIERHSGNPAVDRSVQATLDRVKFAAPLPPDAKEDQRTVTINFNVRAKRLLG